MKNEKKETLMIPFHKNSYIFLIKSFSYISGKSNSYVLGNGTFKPTLENIFKNLPKKISYISGCWTFSSKIKTFLIFLEIKLSSLIFLFISRSNFTSSKNKKKPLWKNVLYFWKWNFLDPSLKNFFIFQKETCKT